MKKSVLFIAGLMLAMCFSLNIKAQTTPGTFTFTFTQTAHTGTWGAKHVLAVWMENGAGTFVKTRMRYWGGGTNDHLPNWVTNSNSNIVVAAATGATRTAYGTVTGTWDAKNVSGSANGTTVADGTYKLMIEETWSHGTTSTVLTSYTFTKSATAVHLTPANDANFTGVVLDWVPAAVAPVADFSATPTTLNTGSTVAFTDLSTNTPTSWAWNFGDGGTSTVQNPTHIYTTAGTYTVALTATNAGGANTATKAAYIVVNQTTAAPVANFVGTPTTLSVGGTVSFTDQSTNTPTSWSWNFGDGGTSVIQNPTHIYATAGTYTIALTATNATGSNTATKTSYITVNQGGLAPVADFSGTPVLLNAGGTVTFSDISTNTPTSWSWSFGDGGISTIQNPSHIYSAAGTYTVALTATNAIGSNTATKNNYIVVNAVNPGTSDTVVKWSFPTNTSASATANSGLAFNLNKIIVTRGGTSTISYTSAGLTTYCARATGWNNGMDTKYWMISFETTGYNTLLLSAISRSSGTGPRDFKIQYTLDTLGTWVDVPNGTVVDSNDYVHGAVSDLPLPIACNNQSLVYIRWIMTSNMSVGGTANVTATGSSRLEDIYVLGSVAQTAAPVANFIATPTTVAVGGTVTFTDQSTNTPTSWSWSFGDGGTSAIQNPTHVYNAAGTYTVALTATNAVGSNTATKNNYIVATQGGIAPVANFTGTPTTVTVGGTVTFTDQSTNTPTSWLWNFGDAGTSTIQNPTHVYNAVGTYTVALTATNASGSNTATKNNYITVTTGGSTSCDTLFYPLNSAMLWQSYACGTNSYGDLAKANFAANITPNSTVSDVYIQFIKSVGTTNCQVQVWSDNAGVPGSSLGSVNVPLATIATDIANQARTAVHFANPITLSGPVYFGVTLPTATTDTLVLLADTSGQAGFNVAWELWSGTGGWYAFNDANSWGKETRLAIFPVVCSQPGQISVTAAASAVTICNGTSAILNATAVGGSNYTYAWSSNPVGFTSNLQNPSVTPTVTTTYTVTATSGINTASASVTLIVNPLPATPTISFNGNTLSSNATTGNQWYFNGAIIPGATAQTYVPTQNGNFQVMTIDINGCLSALSTQYNVTTVGIAFAENSKFNIYPNPTTGTLKVVIPENQQNTVISIYDVLGNLIYNHIVSENTATILNADISVYPSGIYYMHIKTEKDSYIKKISLMEK